MLSVEEAKTIVEHALPGGSIQAFVEYRNLYIFQVFTNLEGEEEYDPFFSVDKETGEFRDFSVITDGNLLELTELFLEAKKGKGDG